MAVFIVASQFYLNSLQTFLPARIMGVLWFIAGTLAGAAAFGIETYMAKRRRFET